LSEKGCWSLSLGKRGCRVLVRQREPGGAYFRVTWIPGQGKSQASLHTTSRVEARYRAEALWRAIADSDQPRPAAPLTLEGLWNRYQQEAAQYRRNTETTRAGKRRAAKCLFAGFDRKAVVEHLCLHDVECYIEKRQRGLRLEDGRQLDPVGARTVESDLQLLRAMLNWATTVKVQGVWLLKENPLRGLELPKEQNPRRALATYERYLSTLEMVQQLAAEAPQRRSKMKWLRVELALVIAEGTGRRLGAIRGLRWSDWDFERATVRWRKEFDKKKYERIAPVDRDLADRVKCLRLKLEAFADEWLFPREDGEGPWDNDLFDQPLRYAERKAGLPKLDGTLWHGYRRKWVTERKPFPEADVMAAGGWRDRRTFQTCYQLPDEDTLLAVMQCPNKLREKKIEASA
jgi:integrase